MIHRLLILWLLFATSGAAATRSSGILNPDTPYETAFYTIDSGKPGPTVLVVAGQHGNEPAGTEAARAITGWDIIAGKLIIVPGANVPALVSRTRLSPKAEEKFRNLNRNYPRGIANEGTPVARGPRARAIWKLTTELKPDWVLDLHEGWDFHRENSRSVGSTLIHLEDPIVIPAANAALDAVNKTISRESRKFFSKTKSGPVRGGIVRSAADFFGSAGIIIETTSRDQSVATRARQHRLMVDAIFRTIGLTGKSQTSRFPPGSTAIVETVATTHRLMKLGIAVDSAHGRSTPVFRITEKDLLRRNVTRQFDTLLVSDAKLLEDEGTTKALQLYAKEGNSVTVVTKKDTEFAEVPKTPKTLSELAAAFAPAP